MDFASKWLKFWSKFGPGGAWKRVLGVGLKNTLIIALSGLVIGIVIGTLIAAACLIKYVRSMSDFSAGRR